MEKKEDDTVVIDTIIHAPVKKVWQAWTDAEHILHWFGSDPNGKGLKASLDVRPGGAYEITFQDSNQTSHTCYGAYLEVVQFSKLKFTWNWKSEPGVESMVTVVLTAEGNNTRMKFEHACVGTASMHNYLHGWTGTFTKLDRVLTGDTKQSAGNRQS
jgi:uncharacterized protein YndB with AHSA1/START domain